MQDVQAARLAWALVPGGQVTQMELPVPATWLDPQEVQADALAVLEYVPTPHEKQAVLAAVELS